MDFFFVIHELLIVEIEELCKYLPVYFIYYSESLVDYYQSMYCYHGFLNKWEACDVYFNTSTFSESFAVHPFAGSVTVIPTLVIK